jgi:hypothetical protein
MMASGRLRALKDRHCGERVVLVANGPSLNRMNLEFLSKEHTIGLNKIFLGLKKFRFIPRYYVAVNDKVIGQSAVRIQSLNCVKFINSRNGALLPQDALTYHVDTHYRPPRFSHDICQGIFEGWTVTYVALQIAFYLGFSEVVLIGLDHRYQFMGEPNEARHLDGPDPNHFSPDYFGGGQAWDNPDLAHSEESFRVAQEEYDKAGRRIIDATVNGACTIFQKRDYREIFTLRQENP